MPNLEKNSQTVEILLATYNGEKYIKAQLLSLLYQSYSDIRVLVHDDGSTDNTVKIVQEIAKKDKRVVLIDDGVILGGAAKNFMHLLKLSKADVLMFCDQDDIWFDNKVEVMIDALNQKESSIPHVVLSAVSLWHPDEGIEGDNTHRFSDNLRNLLFRNGGVQGCATMLNKAMRDLMLRWEGYLLMHDQLSGLLSVTLGDLTLIHRPLMLYRRHSSSVTTIATYRRTLKRQFWTNRELPVVDINYFETVARFLDIYKNDLKEKDRKLIEEFLKMKDKSTFGRIISVIRNRFGIYNSVFMLLIKMVIRPYCCDIPARGRGN